MKYAKQISSGYIDACGEIQNGFQITEDEYSEILAAFNSRPDNPEGYTYKLRDDTLEWELVELPPISSEDETEVTAADYEAALREVGVDV